MLDLQTVFPEQVTTSVMIDDVCYNSREVSPSSVFVALKGTKVDGHNYVANAFAAGAKAVVVEEKQENVAGLQIVVTDTYEALNTLSFLCYPQINPMTYVGVTGTDGKTSTTIILKNLLSYLGKHVGYIGTNGIEYQDTFLDLNCTTPLAPELFQILADMSKQNIDVVSMEVSSHGLVTKRVANIQYDYAIFTNFSSDHLDFHKTLAEYEAAKLSLFTGLKAESCSIINLDDAVATDFIKATKSQKVLTFGMDDVSADYRGGEIEYTSKGMRFNLYHQGEVYPLETRLLGDFNVYNLLAAIAVAHDLGYSFTAIQEAVAQGEVVPGRMELFYHPTRAFSVIVDFGHATGAIENVLKTSRKLTKGQLVVITGAVGDGDKTKRPKMAEASTTYADVAIFTTDHPYSEDPQVILDEMIAGLDASNYQVIVDRETAIQTALDKAQSGDVIVIMGRGRVEEIIYADYAIPFNDYEFVKAYVENTK